DVRRQRRRAQPERLHRAGPAWRGDGAQRGRGKRAGRGRPMNLFRSLRHRVIAGMVLLIALVFGIALLGVDSIRGLDRSVNFELSLLLESTDLGNGLVSSVASEIRSA